MLTVGAYLEREPALAAWQSNLAWAAFCGIFLFVPGLYLVIGRNTGAFSPSWILSSEERPRFKIAAMRMLAWFVSAGGVLALVSLLQGIASH